MKPSPQMDLFASAATPSEHEVEWLVGQLRGRKWQLAEDLLRNQGIAADDPTIEDRKRRLRKLASSSGGRIVGGQGGYCLTVELTAEEFGQFDRRMANQEAEMQRRRIEAQRVFYGRTNVARVAECPTPKDQ